MRINFQSTRALGWHRAVGFERMITDIVDADLEQLA
jgi:hypothetical protein